MAAKIAKYVILSIVGLLVVMVIAIAVVDDETIEASAGPLAGPLLAAKQSVFHGLNSATSGMGDDTNNTPRVVQDLPPPPVSSVLAKPVQTKSLADVAAETQQEYARLQATEEASSSITPEPATMVAETPPPPPPAVETESVNTPAIPSDAPPLAPEPMMAAEPATDVIPTTEPEPAMPSEEMALLESLNEQPSDEVATLSPEAPESPVTKEPAINEEPDPNGEKAYTEGLKYYSGKGAERNFGTAAQYFMKAAERGHADAQYSLGLMNYVGQTGGQDFSNAAKWFQMAAESGHVQAQYNLGFLYYEGKGVGQDLKTAYGWIDRAAKQGYAKAVKARDALQKAMPEMFGS